MQSRSRRTCSRASLLTALALCAGCGGEPEVPPVEADGPASTATAASSGDSDTQAEPVDARTGEERMWALLDAIETESAGRNPFLGRAQVERLRAELARLPDAGDAAARQRLLLLRDLGSHLLRTGESEEATRVYEEALTLADSFGDALPPNLRASLAFDAAVASMRFGEDENCVLRHTAESCVLPIGPGGVHVEQEGSRRALEHLGEVLALTPPATPRHDAAVWLANIAHMTLGTWPAGLEESLRIPADRFASSAELPRFVNVANELGVAAFDLAGGAAADDFDGDGRLDLLTSTSDAAGRMHFFRNDGEGGFDDRTAEANLDRQRGGLNLTTADVEGDGDVDAYVLRGGWFRQWGQHPNSLLVNDGSARFTDRTFESGLGERHLPSQAAGWADYDNDGDLDLYVGNERSESLPDASSQLFENDGTGRFVDVAAERGVTNDRYAKAVSWGDQDRDGWIDLFVSNIGGANRLFRNRAGERFDDVAAELGVEGPVMSFPTWFWDFDADGSLDLFVSAYGTAADGALEDPGVHHVAADVLRPDENRIRPFLFRGDGAGGLDEVGVTLGLTRCSVPMGANYGDLDNDGLLDFYLGTGYPGIEGLMPNQMYLNRGAAGFADVTTAGGFGHLQKGHAVVFADLDDDGDQDVYEQLGGAYPGDAFGNALFENPGPARRWSKISLHGVRSNRHGLGARVYACAIVARYVLTMAFVPELRWFGHAIPIAFHCVLAAWVGALSVALAPARGTRPQPPSLSGGSVRSSNAS